MSESLTVVRVMALIAFLISCDDSGLEEKASSPATSGLSRNPIWQTLLQTGPLLPSPCSQALARGWVCGSVSRGVLATYADDAGCANDLELRGLKRGREVESGAGEEAVKGGGKERRSS
jgi:hypothetical protein